MIIRFSKPFFALLVSLTCELSYSQENDARHQLFAGYGFGYTNKVFGELGEAFNVDFLQAAFSDSSQEGTVMPLYIGYRYLLRKHLGMGFNLAYPLMNVEENSITLQNKNVDKQRFNVLIFLPRIDVIYFNKKIFSLYSGAGIGMIVENKDAVESQQASIALAYHITAIGLSAGKTIGLFMELGYGINGVMSLGIVTKLGEDPKKHNTSEPRSIKNVLSPTHPCIRL